MTTRSLRKPRGLILTSVLWVTGFLFVASTPYGIHAEQQNPAKAATTFGYVTNANDNTISVIDTGSSKVVATIPVRQFPTGVATTPDGSRAYVRNFGNTASVIDSANNTVLATIPVGNGGLNIGTGVAITPDGKHVYVANESDNTVSVIESAGNSVVATIPVGTGPSGIAIMPNGTRAYVANELDQSALGFAIVSVIDTASNTLVANKLTFDMARDFEPYKVAVVSIWPGPTATERAKSVLAKIPGGDEMLESAETPKFSGLAIASLYSDPQLMSKSGSVVIAAEAALEYGFEDFNGKQPPSLREQKGSPRPFFAKS